MNKLIIALLLLTTSLQAQTPVIDLASIVEVGNVTASLSRDSCVVILETDSEKAINLICAEIQVNRFVDNKLRIVIGRDEWFIRKTGTTYSFNNIPAESIARLRCVVKNHLIKHYNL